MFFPARHPVRNSQAGTCASTGTLVRSRLSLDLVLTGLLTAKTPMIHLEMAGEHSAKVLVPGGHPMSGIC